LVTPPLPVISINSLSSSALSLAWPIAGPAYTLQSNSNLVTGTSTAVPPPYPIVGMN
jgi:hypothetical protein